MGESRTSSADSGAGEAGSVRTVEGTEGAANAEIFEPERWRGAQLVDVLLFGGPRAGQVIKARGPGRVGDTLAVDWWADDYYIVTAVGESGLSVIATYIERSSARA